MKRVLRFFERILTSGSGLSSKRFCGLTGWFVLLCCLVYSTWSGTDLPHNTSEFIFGTVALLGVDSVTGIWRDRQKKKEPECEVKEEVEPGLENTAKL
jgi:hypothetical protein